MPKQRWTLLTLILLTITATLHVVHEYMTPLNPGVLMASRWFFTGVLSIYAYNKRSLTTWILVAMVIGIAIGLDFPDFSQNLQFLSKIFLRMVKTIVAPLLFATLVLGIAGHANLNQVGRMVWKSILYFEVLTTLALAFGFFFINLTQAGVGIIFPEVLVRELLET